MAHEVILPQLGETMNEGTIVRWLVKEGDRVQKGDPLFQFESDKAVLDVEAPAGGQVLKLLVPQGARVPVLQVVALIGEPGEALPACPQARQAVESPLTPALSPVGERVEARLPAPEPLRGGGEGQSEPPPSPPWGEGRGEGQSDGLQTSPTPTDRPSRIFASPRARRAAAERGLDLRQVQGSGPSGRIIEADVLAFAAAQPRATPLARKVAAEAGIGLSGVAASGPGGRITRADVDRGRGAVSAPPVSAPPVSAPPVSAPAVSAPAVSAPPVSAPPVSAPPVSAPPVSAPPVSAPPVSAPPVSAPASPRHAIAAEGADTAPLQMGGQVVPLAGVRARIAERMAASARETARVTLTTEVDATRLVEARTRLKAAYAAELGFDIGYNDLLIAICAHALREHPALNSRLEGDSIHLLDEVHVGLAVDTERGLLVPVVRHADRLRLAEIARALRELVARARQGRSGPDELKGGTFTITNLGAYGIDAFTPIINLPECAILGVGRIAPRPAVVDGQLAVRQRLWLSLTFDHRLVDGAPAARFLQRIAQLVEEPYLLLA